ncbi:DUF3622 domain-containing protein [Gilvimarinus sp. 1_MG-2023]|uniref:DUF3622 domain-containing protein n=1 Tax=Gilvimarinus sp. 1_MG-2023 TaxID=3062638 RepID=UPI0026E427B5|nr:DUF3622 domain-containing protein [Gilvimarinus sp. 1_MG-2023]MDO6746266.1 DUF3622 domain-containing protein [Gilvimarinus sp. 1_MG-2023]
MSIDKKFNLHIDENNGEWRAEITRRVTARKTITTKVKHGFTSESDARAWAENELKSILANVRARQQAKS